MIKEQFVSFETAKLLKEAGFNEKCHESYDNVGGFRWFKIGGSTPKGWVPCPTQALAARWLREVHNIDVMVDVYNRDYYVSNVYKNKHLMIIRNIVTSSYEEALDEGLYEAIKLIKK